MGRRALGPPRALPETVCLSYPWVDDRRCAMHESFPCEMAQLRHDSYLAGLRHGCPGWRL
eukprot:1194311-Prorocentrum_minimum.AAC.7